MQTNCVKEKIYLFGKLSFDSLPYLFYVRICYNLTSVNDVMCEDT